MARGWGMSLALLASGCGAAPSLGVDGAWIRLPAVPGRPGAAYLTLHGGAAPATLLAVKTPAAIRSEMHESMASGPHGMMSMAPLSQVTIPAGGSIAFAPGGRHVMLFDISPAMKPGGTATLVLAMADGKTIEAKARVVAAGDAGPK